MPEQSPSRSKTGKKNGKILALSVRRFGRARTGDLEPDANLQGCPSGDALGCRATSRRRFDDAADRWAMCVAERDKRARRSLCRRRPPFARPASRETFFPGAAAR
jgi:hypothetical protein